MERRQMKCKELLGCYKREVINLRILTELVLIQIFILFTVNNVQSSSCPAPCSCVFDDKWENNTSTCDYGNAAVNITWHKMLGRPIITISCQGTNFTCFDLPQFDIHHHQVWVIVKACSPSTLRCLNDVYFQQPSAIESVEVHDPIGADTYTDWEKLSSVWDLRIHLKETAPIPLYAFNSLMALKQVYIEGGDYNQITNINMTSGPNILTLDNMGTKTLPNVVFELMKKSLKILHITGTKFDFINMETFKDMEFLEELEFRNNVIKSIKVAENSRKSNAQLKKLKMEYNSLSFLPDNVFENYFALEKIIIENNQVELKLDNNSLARLAPSVKMVQLNKCKIRQLPLDVFQFTSNVHHLHINDNLIEEIDKLTFTFLKAVRRLSLSGNKIKSIPDSLFAEIKKLEFLDLSGNNIGKIYMSTFWKNSQLKTLLLDQNNIIELEEDVFKGKSFLSVSLAANRLKNVDSLGFLETSSWDTRELNLSHNQIDTFHKWFVELPNLEYLDLSWNNIKKLPNNFKNGQKSAKLTINLRNNEIARVEGEIEFEWKNDDKLTIYLVGNPFECDCMSVRILQDWNERNMIADFQQLTCINGINISTIDVFKLCNKKHAQIALIGTSVVGALFGFIVLVSIFTKWKDIWKYISRDILQTSTDTEIIEMEEEAKKENDIFISFAHEDFDFVKDNLLPKLEFEYGLKVCVHYRDWIVGQLIPDQIIKSVENSRMTIIILTEHFLKSEWSYLEFRTAHSLGQQQGKSRVILILLNESITKDERLNIDIKSYIAINSYLVWKDPYFWTKLEKKLLKSGLGVKKFEILSVRNDRQQ